MGSMISLCQAVEAGFDLVDRSEHLSVAARGFANLRGMREESFLCFSTRSRK